MNRAVLGVITLGLTVGFLSCEEEIVSPRNLGGSSLVPQSAGSSPYFPFEDVKRWDYERIRTTVEDWSDNAPFKDTTVTDTNQITRMVVGETELTNINKIPVWDVNYHYPGRYVHVGDTFADFYKEIFHYDPWYRIPAEPVVGDTWFYDDGSRVYAYKVVADSTEANGYDNCLRIRSTPDNVDLYLEYDKLEYWAPDVGVVQIVYHGKQHHVMFDTMELVRTIDWEQNLINLSGIKE